MSRAPPAPRQAPARAGAPGRRAMVTAQSLVASIKGQSSTPDALVETLKHAEGSLANQGLVTQALAALDPVQHSLGYLVLLCAPAAAPADAPGGARDRAPARRRSRAPRWAAGRRAAARPTWTCQPLWRPRCRSCRCATSGRSAPRRRNVRAPRLPAARSWPAARTALAR